jgi:hypothetical protein
MSRTNDTAVKGILESDPKLNLTPFIRTASALTDWLVTEDTAGKLTTSLLLEIETYLAAHFYSHRDQMLQSKGEGGASGSFQGQTAMVLLSTQYGQTACMLDVTNKLAQRSADAQSGTSRTAGVTWLGSDPDNVTNY